MTFIDFIQASPTSYHAVQVIADRLRQAGFEELDEATPWEEVAGERFVIREGGLIAWRTPSSVNESSGLRIVATHSDSPALKLKPSWSFNCGPYSLTDAEVYGGPRLSTWLDRELKVAGRVIMRDLEVRLIETEPMLRISTVAPHLTRHDSDPELDRQQDLAAIFTLDQDASIADAIWQQAGFDPDAVLASDLFMVPAQASEIFGANDEFLASYRLDNLASTYEGFQALLVAQESADVQVLAVFDHEEIGSGTLSGARGPFLEDVLRRLGAGLGFDQDAYLAWLRRGWCLSSDVAHAVHPTRPQFYEPRNFPVLGQGPVLKVNANGRYASDGLGAAIWERACRQADVPHQVYLNNGKIPGGSTVGPLTATRIGIRTFDVGIPILSMHSAREMCALADDEAMTKAMTAFLAAS